MLKTAVNDGNLTSVAFLFAIEWIFFLILPYEGYLKTNS